MRWCWNWQTGMVEGHVPQGVEVQVLSSAQNPRFLPGIFLLDQSHEHVYDVAIELNVGQIVDVFLHLAV